MKETPGFTAKYHVDQLVWFEEFADPRAAISSEKKLKNWTRAKKIKLVQSDQSRAKLFQRSDFRMM